MTQKVIMYKIPLCPMCVRAKMHLKSEGIAVEQRDITFNKQHQKEMRELTDAMTVPITKIGEQVLVGYHPTAFHIAIENYKNMLDD